RQHSRARKRPDRRRLQAPEEDVAVASAGAGLPPSPPGPPVRGAALLPATSSPTAAGRSFAAIAPTGALGVLPMKLKYAVYSGLAAAGLLAGVGVARHRLLRPRRPPALRQQADEDGFRGGRLDPPRRRPAARPGEPGADRGAQPDDVLVPRRSAAAGAEAPGKGAAGVLAGRCGCG